jgi:hypothetical protein
MSCPCKELEREHGGGDAKCVHYREQFPDCKCEKCSVSEYSYGVVENEEVLIRTLYSPVQINGETGYVDPVHFRQDALKRGLSVNRKTHTTEERLRAKIRAKIASDKAKGKRRDDFYKVVTARCGEIRNLVGEDGQRLFCVYDTAKSDDRSHADVCQAVDPPPGTPNRTSIRNDIGSRLFEVFVGQATDLSAVFDGEV